MELRMTQWSWDRWLTGERDPAIMAMSVIQRTQNALIEGMGGAPSGQGLKPRYCYQKYPAFGQSASAAYADVRFAGS
jgi:hypothetical protein